MHRSLRHSPSVLIAHLHLSAFLFLAAPASSDPPTTSVLSVISFDSTTHDFYWYGHQLPSPLTFAITGTRITVNGIGPPPPDTLGLSALLAPKVLRIPFVRDLVDHGSSIPDAVDAYGCRLPDVSRKAIREYRASRVLGHARARQRALATIDTTIVDMRESVDVDTSRFRATLYGGEHLDVVHTSASLLGPSPCTEPSADEIRDAAIASLLPPISHSLHVATDIVVLAQLNGLAIFQDNDARRVRSDIARARQRARTGALRAEHVSQQDCGLVPVNVMRQIVRVTADEASEP